MNDTKPHAEISISYVRFCKTTDKLGLKVSFLCVNCTLSALVYITTSRSGLRCLFLCSTITDGEVLTSDTTTMDGIIPRCP